MQLQKISKKQAVEISFTDEQIQLIKSQIAPKATNDELKLFLNQCKRTGLDPFARQIYAIHRKSNNEEKMSIQTSIDGFRVIAERSGDYAGQDEPVFNEVDGKIISCKVTVYRFKSAQKYAIPTRYAAAVGVVYWDEYVQLVDEYVNGKKTGVKKPSSMWAKMPHTMLSKVAEAQALRKAYPQDLSGLYTGEEMTQADEQVDQTVKISTIDNDMDKMRSDYCAYIDNSSSLEDLKKLKSILPQNLLGDKIFRNILLDKYNQLKTEETKKIINTEDRNYEQKTFEIPEIEPAEAMSNF